MVLIFIATGKQKFANHKINPCNFGIGA